MRIREFAKLTGVSVRTLHYYDEIGLLKPSSVDAGSGYRHYDEASLLRMQEILFYRELDFSLSTIGEILSDPDYDRQEALQAQKHLLTLKKERLERLIAAIDTAVKGVSVMQAFDNRQYEQYKAEVKEKWGKTEAYREHSEKTKNYSKEQWQTAADGLDGVFASFAACMQAGNAPESDEAQSLVRSLQDCITANYYTCTDEILAGLGQMYVMDERFQTNIDRHAAGTAAYVNRAIQTHRKKL